MSTTLYVRAQSLGEIRTYDVVYTDDLRTGVTISSAAALHIPPSGNATTPTVGTISGAIVPVTLPAQTVTGLHRLDVTATLSDSNKSVVRLMIPVNF